MSVTQLPATGQTTGLDCSPARTFLFDRQRTGRIRVPHTHSVAPKPRWAFPVRSNPPRGVETAPAIDASGNVYFGCHDGCVYSVTPEGQIRWMYKTAAKVYASPALLESNDVVFAGGDGFLYTFSSEGELRWKRDLCSQYRRLSRKRRALHLLPQLNSILDLPRRRVSTTLAWASPNVSTEGDIYAVAQGQGLWTLAQDGRIKQKFDLGWPDFHHSGVAIDTVGNVYVASQQNRVQCLSSDLTPTWTRPVARRLQSWGNPSICPERELITFPFARGEHVGKVIAFDAKGSLNWECDLPGGIRGSVTWNRDSDGIACTLHGYVCKLCGDTGRIKASVKLTNAKRGLWTSATIDFRNRLLITTKDSDTEGSIYCLNEDLSTRWRLSIGKSLSPPVIDVHGNVYVGSWDGTLKCFSF